MEDISSGFWHKQINSASEKQGAKFPENVLELGEEGSRGPGLHDGPVTEAFPSLPHWGL